MFEPGLEVIIDTTGWGFNIHQLHGAHAFIEGPVLSLTKTGTPKWWVQLAEDADWPIERIMLSESSMTLAPRKLIPISSAGASGSYISPTAKVAVPKRKISKKALKEVVRSLFEQDLIAFDPSEGRYFIGNEELLLSDDGLDTLDLIRAKFVPNYPEYEDDCDS